MNTSLCIQELEGERMSCLSFIDKKTICRLFDISDGFVFKYLVKKGVYNKTTTKELLLDSCGINIFEDEIYRELSQQKCIEKIWSESSPTVVAKLLRALCEYFSFQMGTGYWSDEDQYDYQQVEKTIERLESSTAVELPLETEVGNLKILLEDIDYNIRNGKPEMVLDRLHTFTTEYFRKICSAHSISTLDDKGKEYPLHSLVGNLKNWYRQNDFFDSEFCIVAIQNTISIFEKFNSIRNDSSAAHPNKILNRVEAEYAVQVVADTLKFIEKIEAIKKNNNAPNLIAEGTDDLPF